LIASFGQTCTGVQRDAIAICQLVFDLILGKVPAYRLYKKKTVSVYKLPRIFDHNCSPDERLTLGLRLESIVLQLHPFAVFFHSYRKMALLHLLNRIFVPEFQRHTGLRNPSATKHLRRNFQSEFGRTLYPTQII
jgi:hypothetical protein